ncbi:MAG: hypothetical protein JO323_18560 [Acidobacteriia bacterium]|nr:hypothetical protein [Terriglobia bacterium]
MKLYLLALFCTCSLPLLAGDDQQLALEIRAQSDFDRVEITRSPQIQETAACIQSQAALIPVASRAELSSIYFHKGFCTLAGAAVTRHSEDFTAAAQALEKSIEAWPDALTRNGKSSPEPVSSGLRILAAIAHIEAGSDPGAMAQFEKEISAAVDTPRCSTIIMPAALCSAAINTGRQWLGWFALKRGDRLEARREFTAASASSWQHWTTGLDSWAYKLYPEAASEFHQAVDGWSQAARRTGALLDRLAPLPDMPHVLIQLASAQILSGDAAGAIPTLDAATKADPKLSQAIFLRARARELTGQAEQALADYSLASRTAFANAQDLMSGEAHLYRGILFYLRHDYQKAEDEFSSSLNFDIPAGQRPDAEAWRHLAAVAGGACGDSRRLLEEALEHVSPFFPKQQARERAASCPLSISGA